MCGIAGVAASHHLASEDHVWLSAATRLLRHRGPDSQGEWLSRGGHVMLAHTRLAILDPSPAGSQPMSSANGRFTIVFNGEIYNYRELREILERRGYQFISSTDTEVLIIGYQEWGHHLVDRLVGAFAFAIWDEVEKELFLARDRFGEKPLFFVRETTGVAFGSEVKVLLERPSCTRKVNRDSLARFIALGYGDSTQSMVAGIEKLQPGHFLTWSAAKNSINISTYWSALPFMEQSEFCPTSDVMEQLESLLDRAVRMQLVADVPLGVLLSGGIDSSLITAFAARSSNRVRTFTVTFPGHDGFDEGKFARQVADHFSTDHTEIPAGDVDSNVLLEIMQGMDEPIADSSAIATFVLSKLVSRHCTVALGGDGGDELFGGYLHYSHLRKAQSLLGGISPRLRSMAARKLLESIPSGTKGKYWIAAMGHNFDRDTPVLNGLITDRIERVLKHQFWASESLARKDPRRLLAQRGIVGRAMLQDIEGYLPDDILLKVDRMSMLNSLEIRAPFLDRSLAEFVLSSIPKRDMVTRNGRKLHLRSLAGRILPPTLDLQRKQGFSVPLLQWFRDSKEWHELVRDLLLGSAESFHRIDYAKELLEAVDQGRDTSQAIYGLCVLEAWRREFKIS